MCAPVATGASAPAERETPKALGAVPIPEEPNAPLSLAESLAATRPADATDAAAPLALSIRLTCAVCGRDTEPELEAQFRGDGGIAFLVLNVDARCWYCGSARKEA